jgi:hypothetical protein
MHVPFSLSRIIMSGLLLGTVLSVFTCWFYSIVTLLLLLLLLLLFTAIEFSLGVSYNSNK